MPYNKYVHSINMEFLFNWGLKSHTYMHLRYFLSNEIKMQCTSELYSVPFIRVWLNNNPREFVTDTVCECEPSC